MGCILRKYVLLAVDTYQNKIHEKIARNGLLCPLLFLLYWVHPGQKFAMVTNLYQEYSFLITHTE